MRRYLVFCLLLHLVAPLVPAQTPSPKKSAPVAKPAIDEPQKAEFTRQWKEVSQRYPLVARSHRQLEVSFLALMSGVAVAEAKPLMCAHALLLSPTLVTLWNKQCTGQIVIPPQNALSCFRSYLGCDLKAGQANVPSEGCQQRYDECVRPSH